MSDVVSIVPRIRWRDPVQLLASLEALRDEAESAGFGTLGYLLACAAIEARHQIEERQRGIAEEFSDPAGLWRPDAFR